MSFRVLLVDDHQMLREGLRAILELDEDIEVVADAGDGLVAIEMARTLTPDVVIMDIGMEGLNGIDATRQIRADNPRVKVIALSTYSDKSYVLSMLEAGASGYVLKSSAAAEIRRAVRAVAEEQHYLSPDITGVVVKAHVDGSAQTGASVRLILGSRECQILQLLAEGHTSPEIARRLHIATSTVDTHRRNIMNRLDVHSIAELTKYAIRQGLTSLER